MLIVLVIMVLLVVGVRESARANAMMVAIKLVAVLFFIGAGATYVKPENWSPFAPYGWSGIMAAGAVVFFAYIGFNAVSTTAEEAKNPQARSADWHHRVARGLHHPVSGGGGGSLGIIPVVQYRSAADALPGVAWFHRRNRCAFSTRRWPTLSL